MSDERIPAAIDLTQLRPALARVLALAEVLARLTPTPLDDVAVRVLRALVGSGDLQEVMSLVKE